MSGGGGEGRVKDTAAQKALAQIAARRFNLYQQYYVPLENEFMNSVFSMKDPSAFANVEGFVTSLQQPEFQDARSQMQRQAFAAGADVAAEGLGGAACATGLCAVVDRPHRHGDRRDVARARRGALRARRLAAAPREPRVVDGCRAQRSPRRTAVAALERGDGGAAARGAERRGGRCQGRQRLQLRHV